MRLAQKCGRPVKLALTREEVLQGGSGPAAGALIDVRGGGRSGTGHLVAIEGTYRMDAGGLPGLSPSLIMQASAALYQCANLNLQGFDVVTNKPRTEAYRGPAASRPRSPWSRRWTRCASDSRWTRWSSASATRP